MGRQYLSIHGPPPLSVDWSRPDHRRIVVACLVEGTYLLESNRQDQPSEAPVNIWWESFHFKLVKELVDRADSSIFGAVYEIAPPPLVCTTTDRDYNSSSDARRPNNLGNAPKFVIVFRGTLLKRGSWIRDFELNFHIFANRLHERSRCKDAMKHARGLVEDAGQKNVWIAGHSLGAAMASFVGKKLAKEGSNVMAFLFNPPFITAPTARIKHKPIKEWLHNAHDKINAFVIFAKAGGPKLTDDSFNKLCSWVPNVYVHPKDDICSTYIGHFEHREGMEKEGLGHVWRLAQRAPLRDMILHALGLESNSAHLLPSANLIVNHTPVDDFVDAHTISQWWHPHHQDLQAQEYLMIP